MWMLFNSVYVLSCMWIICTWLNNWGCLRTLWRQYIFFSGWALTYLEIAVDNILKNKLLWLIVKLLIRFATADGLVIFQSMSCLIGEHIIVFSLVELIKFACGYILTLCWLGWHNGQINPWLSGLTLFNPCSIGDCVDIDIIAVSLIELRFFPGLHINSVLIGLTWWPD